MKKFLPLLLLISIGSLCQVMAQEQFPATGQPTIKRYDVRLYGLVESFDWRETVKGQELVKETGPLFGLGGDVGLGITETVWIEFNGEFFLGDVDYDGFLQGPQGLTPAKSKTSYVGVKGSADLALKIPITQDVYVKPYAGIGVRAWRRDLDKSLSDSEVGEYGYTETWASVYGLLGVGAGVRLHQDCEIFGNFAVKLPVYNQERVDLSANGGPSDIELKPGKEVSICAEGGLNYKWLTASVFAETLKFSQSDVVDGGYQPDSKATIVGAKLGLHF